MEFWGVREDGMHVYHSKMGCDYLSQTQFNGNKKNHSIGISHIKSDSNVSRKMAQQSLMVRLTFKVA